ncbi:MAG: cbb3-type cytochrome c oxidase subunit 3 [Stellaceae bacterium]
MDWVALVGYLHAPLSVLMLVIFCAIVAWTYAPRRRRDMDDSARIPLRDDR